MVRRWAAGTHAAPPQLSTEIARLAFDRRESLSRLLPAVRRQAEVNLAEKEVLQAIAAAREEERRRCIEALRRAATDRWTQRSQDSCLWAVAVLDALGTVAV